MCGIAGFVSFGGHQTEEARGRLMRMTDAIAYRGPDEEGAWVDDSVALGHRRLSIIDLGTGQQPMAALDGSVQIVFNGEIYNYQDLRRELQQIGHQFRTQSDTEVILQAYVAWGAECVQRLSGMFAFAIWDARVRRLMLARDRVGKKPLYYFRQGDTIAFASELKALRCADLCPQELDPQALDCYFTLGYIPSPLTIYSGVRKLQAARTLMVDALGMQQHCYWSLDFSRPEALSMGEAVDQFEALLDDAVRCRLVSEVPLGAFLSGGLDSSLVVSSMVRVLDRPVITNSIGFDDAESNELPVARRIAAHLGTDHHEYVVTPNAADVLERIAWHFCEPLADSSALPTWHVCEKTRQSVTVALSGDGGDEAFGGYTFRYIPHVWESRLRQRVPPAIRAALFGPLGAIWPRSANLPRPLRLKSIFENLAVGDAEAYYRDLIWLRPDDRSGLYSVDFTRSLCGFSPMELVRPLYAVPGAPDSLARSQHADINFFMTDDVLMKVDRMSMAHSLEVRCPLLDHRVLEFAARLPARLKLEGGHGKLPMRRLAERRLPAQVNRLPKRGFSVPAARWLREDLASFAGDLILCRSGLISELLDPEYVKKLWIEHQRGQQDHHVVLWGLMMFAMWERRHLRP